MRRAAAAALLAAVTALGPAATAGAAPTVGVYVDGVLNQRPAAQRATFDAIHRAGLRFVRVPFEWRRLQAVRGRWEFRRYDSLVLAAARAHLRVLPDLYLAPVWAIPSPLLPGQRGMAQPDVALFAAFAATLVHRYGHGGSFWREHPAFAGHAITHWQVWNEPNHPFWWPGGADAPAYARLLEATAARIRATDPRARVVAAGIPDSTTSMWDYVRDLYQAGAGSSFDVLAIHPYARTPLDAFALVRATRREMAAFGDAAKPMWITEMGWASGGPPSDFTLTTRGQAAAERSLLRLLLSAGDVLGVRAATLFQWQDAIPPRGQRDLWPYHAGLVRVDGRPKPVLSAIRRLLAVRRR